MTTPEITVAIPTKNRIKMLRSALTSVLLQDFDSIEVIVSDNASIDGTDLMLEALSDSRLRFFCHKKSLSMHENWNFCLAKARGRFFLLLSDDDVLLQGAIRVLWNAFKVRGVKMAYAPVFFMDAMGAVTGESRPGPQCEDGSDFVKHSLNGGRWVYPSAVMHYTAAARVLGGYPEIGSATDFALRLAIVTGGRVCCCDSPLVKYRVHSGSLTRDVAETISSMNMFVQWASNPDGPLVLWKSQVDRFCARILRIRAFSSALNGDRSASDEFLSAADKIAGYGWQYKIVLLLCRSRIGQALAVIRRRIKAFFSIFAVRNQFFFF